MEQSSNYSNFRQYYILNDSLTVIRKGLILIKILGHHYQLRYHQEDKNNRIHGRLNKICQYT